MTWQRLYQQLVYTQVIVVVSPSAVQFGMAHLLQSGLTVSDLQHIQWIAVGQKKQRRLWLSMVWIVWCREVETSEGDVTTACFAETWPAMRALRFGGERVGVSL